MALGTLLGMTGLIDDSRPTPPDVLSPQTVDFNRLFSEAPGFLGGANREFLNQYFQQAGPYAQQQQGLLNQFAPQYYGLQANLENQFLPQMAQAQRGAAQAGDPTGFALREQLGRQLSGNLATQGGLNPTELFNAQQDIRSGQSRLGVQQQGVSDLFDEARFLGNTRFARNQANQGAAQSFLGLNQPGQNAANRSLSPTAPNTSGLLQQLSPQNYLQGSMQATALNNNALGDWNSARMSGFINDPNTYAENDLDKLYRLESSVQGIFSGLMGGGMLGGGGGGGGLSDNANRFRANPTLQ